MGYWSSLSLWNKITVNPALKDLPPPPNNQPWRNFKLAGNKVFSKLDLVVAYNQVELDESQQLGTLAIHNGYYKCKRLLSGIKTAPSLWQAAMEQVLEGLPGVQV